MQVTYYRPSIAFFAGRLIKIDKMYLKLKFYQIDNFKHESPANKAKSAIIFR